MQTSFPPNPVVTGTVFAAGRKFDWDGNTWTQTPQFTAMEQTIMVCVNKTGADILKGQVLYYDGHQQGLPLVGVADATDTTKSGLIIGVAAEDFATDMEGLVVTFGQLRGVDTSAFTDEDEVWLSTSGTLTAIKPADNAIRIGFVVASHQYDGVLLVDVQRSTDTGPYGVIGFLPDKYYANDLVLLHVAAWPITFPANLPCSKAAVLVGSASTLVFQIQKNGTQVGSVTFNASELTGTYTAAAEFSLVPGDLLSVVAPPDTDPTFSNLTLTIVGQRTGDCVPA